MSDPVRRKRRHVEVCLDGPVEYVSRTTGFELYDLPYRALPGTDLASIDTTAEFLGHALSMPLLIGAMTGGAELSARINRNLALAAQRTGVGMMLGSQRVMIERPATRSSFEVRPLAPDILLLANLGVAQLGRGYGATELRHAVESVAADGLALHTNPLQEAVQEGGDTDFRGLADRLSETVPQLPFPVLLKEVGHGLSAATAREAVAAGVSAIDVAGAGGTSWARVEELVKHGEVRHFDLVEWGIPTATALREVRSALPGIPLVASGGIRSGLDIAKALAMGATACAVARPLLRPATESAEAVERVIEDLRFELRVAMHGSGVHDLSALAGMGLRRRPEGRRMAGSRAAPG